jgi:hypothetical protein
MARGIVFAADGARSEVEAVPGPADDGSAEKVLTRATKIKALRDKVKAGTATAAEKDKLLWKLASQVLSLTDDLDDV